MRNFHKPGRSSVYATNGMVATSHPLAATEALAILRDGGNAVDAAIAGAVLLGGCEPHMTGLGGDCFALIKPAGSENVIAVNGSGRAPKATSPDTVRSQGVSQIEPGHPASITVPGAVDAFCRMSESHGRLGLDRVLDPAIQYFEQGIPVAPRVAMDFATLVDNLAPSGKAHYLSCGRPFALGERFAMPGQAEVLRRVVKNGRDAFYTGDVAEDMLTALNGIGAVHQLEDFAETQTTFADPISGNYRGTDIVEHPPNGQGATAILLANILSEFDIASMNPSGTERLHLETEATKLAYNTRNRFLSDPEYMTRLDHMLNPKTGKSLAALIDPKKAMPDPAPLSEAVHKDTVLITVVDRDGMAVSLIYSIFASFGSGVASDKFGILFHNRGSGFNLTQGHPNELGPGKRPLHTILPGMTRKNGRIDMTFGVMGGQYQATGHCHLISNIIDFGMDPQAAIDTPRVFPEAKGLRVEGNLSEETRQGLIERGHRLYQEAGPIGGAQAIQINHDTGTLIAGSDPRKDGIAVGY
ncbi:gamma-glutamyltransferase family protein [Boseongicola aestuarii]|uniref:Putative gamma-glutamyltransferase YwrD n=1 Tax=Boseongicola aestuarii TaxID=1470561 RepID=A0A238IY59_9RHOB|nr:gamma-glutamyltransferase family protein [Boseongicola aestuarii]SMX22922.1 Putative gamma-glutamyltransferase YwrD [Boseongicola aestuarii]